MKSASARHFALLAACSAILCGCGGGTKLLKEEQPITATKPLAETSDERVDLSLEWIIVRDGPGTWARNADWDEYLLRVVNRSDAAVVIEGITVFDSLDTALTPFNRRKDLVKASKQTARRYRDEGIEVKAGQGAGSLLVAGAAVTVVGAGAVTATAMGAVLGGTSATVGAAGGLLILGPAIAVGGVFRGMNNSSVNTAIGERHTPLPRTVDAGDTQILDVFFPIAPSPQRIEVLYSDTSGSHRITLDTYDAVGGLHLTDGESGEGTSRSTGGD